MRAALDRRAIVAGAIAAAVLAISLAGGGYGDTALAVTTAGVWLALLGMVLAGRVRAQAPPVLLVVAGALVGLSALTALSFSWAPSDETAFTEVVRTVGYAGVVLLAGFAAGRGRIGVVVAGISIAVVAVALVALASRLLFVGGDASLVEQLPTAAGRLSFPVGYWNALGALMAIGLPGIVWLAAAARDRRVSALALAAVAPPLLVAYMASSRGALLAAGLGIGVVVAFAADRRRALGAAVAGVAATVPAIVAATVATGILDSSGGESPGRAEALVLLALAAGVAAAAVVGPRAVDLVARSRLLALRVPFRTWPIALGVALTVAIVLAGPAVLVGGDDGQAGEEAVAPTERVGVVSTSASGRTSFWNAALDAFAEEPVRGIGAGSYAGYWNEHGDLATATRSAHSEPLEVLAELGLVGFACFAAFLLAVLVAGIAVARARDGTPAVAALGLIVAALVGFTIDWTWQIPAVAIPFLLAAGAVAGSAPPRRRPVAVPATALTVGVAAVAVGALWTAGALAAATSRLEASEDAVAEGRLDRGAAAARAAMSVQPWAAEPWLRLAEIEDEAGNKVAALAAAREAVRRSPKDYRGWLLAARIQAESADAGAGASYQDRGTALYPYAGDRD